MSAKKLSNTFLFDTLYIPHLFDFWGDCCEKLKWRHILYQYSYDWSWDKDEKS